MKIRNGFVSNSSSSSFILHVKNVKPCKHCGNKGADISQIFKNGNRYSDNEVGLELLDQKKFIKEREDDCTEDELKNPNTWLNKLKAKLKKVKSGKLYEISIPYGSDSVLDLVNHMPGVTILEDLN
jgi:hypothetical protein